MAHNTVYFSHPEAYPSGIEYRWDVTQNLTMHGTLTNKMIRARDGATATDTDNNLDAVEEWFIDAPSGDLHLMDCALAGGVGLHPAVQTDMDGEDRSDPTIAGADVCTGP